MPVFKEPGSFLFLDTAHRTGYFPLVVAARPPGRVAGGWLVQVRSNTLGRQDNAKSHVSSLGRGLGFRLWVFRGRTHAITDSRDLTTQRTEAQRNTGERWP